MNALQFYVSRLGAIDAERVLNKFTMQFSIQAVMFIIAFLFDYCELVEKSSTLNIYRNKTINQIAIQNIVRVVSCSHYCFVSFCFAIAFD